MKLSLLLCAVLLCPLAARADAPTPSTEFNTLVKRIYNFDTKKVTETQWKAKAEQLDYFWDRVRRNRAQFLPLLRAKVADPKSRPYFRYDGVNLLVKLDPSLASKRLQVDVYTNSPLDFIEEGRWVSVLTRRGTEGFDVSKAAKRALDDTHMFDEEDLSNAQAAQFLWASQTEERSTPQLFRLANDLDYKHREEALAILLDQATPRARDLIKTLDQTELSDEALIAIRAFTRSSYGAIPRHKSRIGRAQFLRAFRDLLKGDSDRFDYITGVAPDYERDAATVLLPSDLPTVRRLRRVLLRDITGYSLQYYQDFTEIIFALMRKDGSTIRV